MEKKNKYITVLDFERGIVFQYKVPEFISDLDNDYCEEYITEKGHNLTNCEWMVHEFQGFHVGSPMLNTI